MRAIHAAGIATVLALAGVPGGAQSGTDTAEEYVPDLEMSQLYKAPLPGLDGKEMIVVRITAPPSFVGERHKHPGPVFMYVLQGEVVIETEEETITAKAGDLVPEPIDVAMQPRNASDSEPAELLVFQVGDIGKPMMQKAE